MAENRNYTSVSEQYVKKSNRRLLFFGLILFVIFAAALFALSSRNDQSMDTTPIDYNTDDFEKLNNPNADSATFPRGAAILDVVPKELVMENVVLGSNVESVITLTAANAPIFFLGAELAEEQQDGFKLETNCVVEKEMQEGETCNIKVLWNPVSLLQLSNNLTVTWRENNPAVFRNEKTVVQIRANSTDSKDCVICENVSAEASKKTRMAMGLDGQLYEVDDEGFITIDGKRYKVTEDSLAVDEDGNILAIVQPERLPLGLDHKILGTISPAQDVIDASGNKLGRLLGDGTIVDSNLTVLGAAVPVVSVMDDSGTIIGKLLADGSVVNANNSTIGRPLVDGSVIDLQGNHLGYLRPWGLVIDFGGFVIGGATPDGFVVDAKQQKMAIIKPNGLALNAANEIIGGIVPTGVAVGAGCQAVGSVALNGQVKDSYEQVIGRTLPDGSVVDERGEDLGNVISQGLVINEKGLVQGFVNSEGKAVDAKGAVIGCVNPDGSVTAGKRSVGAVMAKGTVVGYGCEVVGSVYPNGVVVNAQQEGVARVLADRYVKNSNNRIVGVVIPRGTAIGEGCRLLGLIHLNGRVISPDNLAVGCVDIELNVVDQSGKVIGAVNYKGQVANENGQIIGRVRLDGKVVDAKGVIIGCVNPDGTVVDLQGNPIGYAVEASGGVGVRGMGSSERVVLDLDGKPTDWVVIGDKVYDKDGNLIGSVLPDGTVVDLNGKKIGEIVSSVGGGIGGSRQGGGVVLDASGKPTGYTIVGNKVYDQSGNLIGEVLKNSWVVDENAQLIGIVPPDGVIYSPDGLMLGRYSRQTGVATDLEGNRFARILPDMTAVSGETDDIIGALIADKTTFMKLDGSYLGAMRIDGLLLNTDSSLIGAIRADGSVVDKAGQIIGTKIPTGRVLGVLGGVIGTARADGVVVSMSGTQIGRILGNGLAISDDGRVLGAVFPEISVAIGTDGSVLGGVTAQGTVIDQSARTIGTVSPFGFIFDDNGQLIGRLVRIGAFVDQQNRTIGWLSFKGELEGKSQRTRSKVLSNGVAINNNNQIIGQIVPRGVAVNEKGSFVGTVSVDGRILGKSTEVLGSSKGNGYFYDANGVLSGLIMKSGLAVSLSGEVLGWTGFTGQIINNLGETIGYVGLDGRVFSSANRQLIGSYVSFDTFAGGDEAGTFGVLNANGVIVDGKGQRIGSVLTTRFAAQEGKITSRLFRSSDLVTDFIKGSLLGQVMPGGTVLFANDNKVLGTMGANGLAAGLTKKVAGGLVPVGVPQRNGLSVIGQTALTGGVFAGGAQTATTMPNTALYDTKGQIFGYMAESDIFIGREGAVIGMSSGTSTILSLDGKQMASYMPFGSALTTDNLWAGGVMPQGTVVNDDAHTIGVVAVDGAVMDRVDEAIGRIMTDGAAVGVEERNRYGTMPYIGGLAKQGLPVGFKDGILGRTTIAGDVLDAADKKAYRLLDDGTVIGGDLPLAGVVVSMNPVIAHNGSVLGTPTGDGTVVSESGEEVGTIATNGTAKGGRLEILGSVVPERLVVNDCKIVGQTALNGQVINGRGDVVGRIMVDKWAQNTRGEKIGRISRNGPVLSPEGDYLGRTLPDSTVVDLKGVNLGCARNDGTVVDNAGTIVGAVVERGAVMDENGNFIGRVKYDGSVVNKDGEVISKVLGDGKGTVVDLDGNKIARVVSPDEEILYNDDGTVAGTLSSGGEVKDTTGKTLFTVRPNDDIINDKGEVIGTLDEKGDFSNGVLGDADGNIIGIISGCDVNGPKGTKIGSIMPDGSIMDLNGGVFAVIGTDRKLYDSKGNVMGNLNGVNVNLDKCGVKLEKTGSPYGISGLGGVGRGAAGASAGRRIFIGNKVYDVSGTGSIVDSEGTIIGYMGDDGRPYGLNDKPFSVSADGSVSTRTRPDLNKPLVVSEEQKAQMQQLLAQRRAGMKAARSGTKPIQPSGRILARAKKKQDEDWGVGKIVSSWPVDMSRMILKDKAIPAVLVHSLDSRYPNVPATAIVERHIYSESGRNIIIPAGSRLIGRMSGSGNEGKVAKVDISWERLIRPDGGAFQFSANSGDAQGRGGVAAYLDNELMKRYGQPVLISAARSAITYLIQTDDESTTNAETGTVAQSGKEQAASDARQTFMSDMKGVFDQILMDATGVPPVLFVPSGTRLTVFANEDLWLRTPAEDEKDYEEQFGADTKQAQKPQVDSWLNKRSVPQQAPAPAVEQYYEPNDPNYPMEEGELMEGGEEVEPIYNGEDAYPEEYVAEEPMAEEKAVPAADPLENRVVEPVLPRKNMPDQLF